MCSMEVRGRQTALHHQNLVANAMAVGDNEDFQDLQPPILETEPVRRLDTTGGIYVTTTMEGNNHAEIEEE